jgi:hypothetical protein
MNRFARRSTVLLLTLIASTAAAKLSDEVVAAFRGKIVLSRGALPAGSDDKETISKIKAAQLTELVGKPTDEGQSWTFHYTAFLKKTGNVALKLQFVSAEQDRRLAVETPISIPDVDSPVLSGDLTLGESRGLERGKAYQLKLVNDAGEVVAKAPAILK